jgi:hypothetical protein
MKLTKGQIVYMQACVKNYKASDKGMKLSKLINKLQDVFDTFGDVNVYIDNWVGGEIGGDWRTPFNTKLGNLPPDDRDMEMYLAI